MGGQVVIAQSLGGGRRRSCCGINGLGGHIDHPKEAWQSLVVGVQGFHLSGLSEGTHSRCLCFRWRVPPPAPATVMPRAPRC